VFVVLSLAVMIESGLLLDLVEAESDCCCSERNPGWVEVGDEYKLFSEIDLLLLLLLLFVFMGWMVVFCFGDWSTSN
jgi:hypothetical protein